MRNVVLAPARVGLVVGSPLAAKAYLTPEHPEGILQEDLKRATAETQRQTALLWFAANLQPFPKPGAIYFGFTGAAAPPKPFTLDGSVLDGPDVLDGASIGGFGQGTFAPANSEARQYLEEEFRAIIPEEEIAALAQQLPGRWSWLEADGGDADADTEAGNPLVRELALLRHALEAVQEPHGGYGHNSRNAPLFDDEVRTIVESVIATQASVAAQQPLPDLQRSIEPAADARPKIVRWLSEITPAKVAGGLAVGVASAGGKDLYTLARDHVPWMAILHHLQNVLHLLHLL